MGSPFCLLLKSVQYNLQCTHHTVTAPSAQEARPSDDRKQPSPWRQQSELVSCRSNASTRNLMPSMEAAETSKSARRKLMRENPSLFIQTATFHHGRARTHTFSQPRGQRSSLNR